MTRARLRVLLVEIFETAGTVESGESAVPLGRVLRDAGMEVVHAGPLGTAEQIVRTAEQEDPDALGLVGHTGTGSVSLEELHGALAGVRLFVLGSTTGGAENAGNIFGSPEEAAKWLAGGRAHTPGTPPDRAR